MKQFNDFFIHFLSLQGEIETSLPSGSPVAALQGSPVVAELRKLMETVDTIKAERDVIEAEIKNAKCDMCKWDFLMNSRHHMGTELGQDWVR